MNTQIITALHTRRALLRLIFPLSLACLLLVSLPIRTQDGPDASFVRFHVLAASDSDEDIADKYLVRDALLPTVGSLVKSAADTDEALSLLSAHADELEEAARLALAEKGTITAVRVEAAPRVFEERTLGTTVFPAGEYPTLYVTLGEGSGHNCWGILFPGEALYFSSDLPADILFDPAFDVRSLGEVRYSFRVGEWFRGLSR